ncbi:MAG: succinylglutamate desuccinylase/aspartoacylase family protein [Synergistaceae bacterium]|nr:succinylglutamate desuccinylase/aspartoacylase family protein [Synergistaceae bacterium]
MNEKIQKNRGSALTATLLFAAALLVCWLAARDFMKMWEEDAVIPVPEFKKAMLSDYLPKIGGTPLDTAVYIQDSGKPGGTVFVLGGTHPNEPSGWLTAVLFLENARVSEGRLIVLPFAMNSGFRHNFPQEASPSFIHIPLPGGGNRKFRYGSRDMQHTIMWPAPDIYIHKPSGQELAGNESKNLNRNYPGDPDGSPAEQIGFAIMELIRKEKVDLAFDLHEASPEYPVIDAIVAHERSMELAAAAAMELKGMDIEFRLEPSPPKLRGLSHREWGDGTDTMPILMETGNPSQGRLRGRTDEALVLTGKDKAYVKARDLGILFIPYADGDQPLDLRVARHVTAIRVFMETLEFYFDDKNFSIEGIPDYDDILKNGVGAYLKPAV